MVAGVLGMAPDDRRLFEAFELAAAAGVRYSFEFHLAHRELPPQRHEVRADRRERPHGDHWSAFSNPGGAHGRDGRRRRLPPEGHRPTTSSFCCSDPRKAASPRASSASPPGCRGLVSTSSVTAPDKGALHVFALAAGARPRAGRRGLAKLLPKARLALLRAGGRGPSRGPTASPSSSDTNDAVARRSPRSTASRSGRPPCATRSTPQAGRARRRARDHGRAPPAWMYRRPTPLRRETRGGAPSVRGPFKPDLFRRPGRGTPGRARPVERGRSSAETIKLAYRRGAGIPGVN